LTLSLEGDVNEPKPAASNPKRHEPTETVLRAKYLDYCSARVAEVLLHLSPDEMYLLAQDAAREAGRVDADPLRYDEMVRLATGRLSAGLALPSFEEWAEAYRQDPARFERELLGLWKSELDEED
jgi:hypothetical protein